MSNLLGTFVVGGDSSDLDTVDGVRNKRLQSDHLVNCRPLDQSRFLAAVRLAFDCETFQNGRLLFFGWEFLVIPGDGDALVGPVQAFESTRWRADWIDGHFLTDWAERTLSAECDGRHTEHVTLVRLEVIDCDCVGRMSHGIPSVTEQISSFELEEKTGGMNGRPAQCDDSESVFVQHNLPGGFRDVENGRIFWASVVVQFASRKVLPGWPFFVADDVTVGRRICVVIGDPVGEILSGCVETSTGGWSSAHGHSGSLDPIGPAGR